jgi:hypothetical protein
VLDGSVKTDEAIVAAPEGTESLISFTFPPTLIVGAVYKVNVYAVVETANQVYGAKLLLLCLHFFRLLFLRPPPC